MRVALAQSQQWQICREGSIDRGSEKNVASMKAGVRMDIKAAFEVLARLLTFRSRLLLILNTQIEDWYSAEACSARAIFGITLQCFTGLPASGGASMVIFRWIMVGTVVAGVSVALLYYRRLTDLA
jgi:hypothetical protein